MTAIIRDEIFKTTREREEKNLKLRKILLLGQILESKSGRELFDIHRYFLFILIVKIISQFY